VRVGEQTQLSETEPVPGVCEGCGRQQAEADRLRTSYREVERALAVRERAHRHRVKGLEEQVRKKKQVRVLTCNL
jgi:predicted Fe-S protein YdhL (DUF1289 family)